MKKFAKLLTSLLLSVLMLFAVSSAGGCNDAPAKWDGRTFTVSVYLPDGTTPTEGLKLALCYNTSETSSSCLDAQRTDAQGKITFTIPANIEFVGNPVLHFTHSVADKNVYPLPDGCGMPTNVEEIIMNHPSDASASDIENCTYKYALELTQKETKLVLTVAE